MFQMPEKAATTTIWKSLRWWNPMLHWGFKVLTLAFFLGILTVWSINGFDLSGFHRYFIVLELTNTHKDYSKKGVLTAEAPTNLRDFSTQLNFSFHYNSHPSLTLIDPNQTIDQQILVPDIASLNFTDIPENAASTPANLTQNQPNVTYFSPQVAASSNYSDHNITQPSPSPENLGWISAELGPDYSKKLLRNWLAPGGEPFKDSRTVDINLPKLDGHDHIELSYMGLLSR